MSTIVESLENAAFNLKRPFTAPIGMNQLENAIALLWKGYGPHDDVDKLLEKHETVDNVPDKPETQA